MNSATLGGGSGLRVSDAFRITCRKYQPAFERVCATPCCQLRCYHHTNMPLGRSHGYDPVEIQHPDLDRPPTIGQSSRRTSYDTTQEVDYDAKSYTSTTPLGDPPSYPPFPKASKHAHVQGQATHHQHIEGLPYNSGSQSRPHNSRDSSWDLLAGIHKFEHEYEEFDTRKVSQPHLQFAEGDLPQNRFVRFYHYLLSVSIVTRWTLFIVPVLAILWIPGILSLTQFPNANVSSRWMNDPQVLIFLSALDCKTLLVVHMAHCSMGW